MNRIIFQQFFQLTIAFLLTTILGTIHHELGHWTVAKILDIPTEFHFGSVEYLKDDIRDSHYFLLTLGGPLNTILWASAGFVAIVWRKKRRSIVYHSIDWILIFLSLFWLRQLVNPFVSISQEIINPNGTYFSGDEVKLASSLGWWEGSISIFLAAIALFILSYLYIAIIPKNKKVIFFIANSVGGITAYYLWMDVLGPILLP